MKRQVPLDPAACRALVESERWKSRITVTADGCWLIGYAVKDSGYATCTTIGDRTTRLHAHRIAFVAAHGQDVADGMHVGHLCHDAALAEGLCQPGPCDHRRCVNPAHLVEQTARDNVLASGSFAADYAKRTHCRAGHALTVTPRAGREDRRGCIECQRQAEAERGQTVQRARQAVGLGWTEYAALFGRSRTTAQNMLEAIALGRDPASIVTGARIALDASDREGVIEWIDSLRSDRGIA